MEPQFRVIENWGGFNTGDVDSTLTWTRNAIEINGLDLQKVAAYIRERMEKAWGGLYVVLIFRDETRPGISIRTPNKYYIEYQRSDLNFIAFRSGK